MPDFRVADTAPEHPKLRSVGLAAFGLWSAAGAMSMRDLTDGFVPGYWVTTWPGGKRSANALVSVGLWDRTTNEHGVDGYRFHDWADYQRSAASIHDERQKGRERAQRSRARSGARSPEPSASRSPSRGADVRRESHDSLPLPLTPGGPGGMNGSPPAGADSQPPAQSPPRCPDHAAIPADQPVPPCGACRDLRRQHEDRALAAVRAGLDQRASSAAARRAAIDGCDGCDDQGWRDTGAGVVRCDHQPAEAPS